jgi:hypothetical protein
MSLQSIKAKLLAVGLFTLSACGTVALFGAVPVIARILSDDIPSTPPGFQAFPDIPGGSTAPESGHASADDRL